MIKRGGEILIATLKKTVKDWMESDNGKSIEEKKAMCANIIKMIESLEKEQCQ